MMSPQEAEFEMTSLKADVNSWPNIQCVSFVCFWGDVCIHVRAHAVIANLPTAAFCVNNVFLSP